MSKIVKNYEDIDSYEFPSPELELFNLVMTSTMKPLFYEPDPESQYQKFKSLVRAVDPQYAASVAIYGKEKGLMRDAPLMILVELAKIGSPPGLVRKLANRVVKRADEMAKVMKFYAIASGKRDFAEHAARGKAYNNFPKQLQKGLADCFNKFNEYHFGKYKKSFSKAPTLKDAMCLLHPKPATLEQGELFRKIANGTLEIPYTWEVEMARVIKENWSGIMEDFSNEIGIDFRAYTRKGIYKYANENISDKGERADFIKKFNSRIMREKTSQWQNMIDYWVTFENGKVKTVMNYMAMMRNLRNIVLCGVDEARIRKVAAGLSDKRAVKNSKQLPFRFLAAYRVLSSMTNENLGPHYWPNYNIDSKINDEEVYKKVKILQDALEVAVKYSIDNVKGFSDDKPCLIAADVSSSMWAPVSGRRGNNDKLSIKRYDIGLILALLLKTKTRNHEVGIFGDHFKIKEFNTDHILAGVEQLYSIEGEVGYGTFGEKVINYAINFKKKFDRIAIFTDGQMQMGQIDRAWMEYKKLFPEAKLYLFMLAPYGTVPVEVQNDVFVISGWSETIFDVVNALENADGTIHELQNMEI